jgi:hypothetical protein
MGLPLSVEDIVTHEVFSHAYNYDQGKADQVEDINPKSGVERQEGRAVRTENIHRRAAHEKIRLHYGKRKVENPEGDPNRN